MARISSGALSLLVSHICPLPLGLCAPSASRVHFQTFEGGIGAPRFLASERAVGSLIDRTLPARDAGARVINIRLSGLHGNPATA